MSLYQSQRLASNTNLAGKGLAGLDEPRLLGLTLSSSTSMTASHGDTPRAVKSQGQQIVQDFSLTCRKY